MKKSTVFLIILLCIAIVACCYIVHGYKNQISQLENSLSQSQSEAKQWQIKLAQLPPTEEEAQIEADNQKILSACEDPQVDRVSDHICSLLRIYSRFGDITDSRIASAEIGFLSKVIDPNEIEGYVGELVPYTVKYQVIHIVTQDDVHYYFDLSHSMNDSKVMAIVKDDYWEGKTIYTYMTEFIEDDGAHAIGFSIW